MRTTSVTSDWRADQVIAILRNAGRPLNSTEIAQSTPYMHAQACSGRESPRHAHFSWVDEAIPLGDHVGHVLTRGHTTAGNASEVLKRLQNAGVVTREKVDRRVMWSLAPAHLAQSREVATRAAVILAGAELSGASEDELAAARRVDAYITPAQILSDRELRELLAKHVAELVARGAEIAWNADPHRSARDDDDYTASVDFRSNGPLSVVVVSVWEGAPIDRQMRAIEVASRHIDNEATRKKWPDGFVIR